METNNCSFMRKNESFSTEDKIQTLEEELATAAEAGLALLKSNQELQERCEKEALFYQKQIEELKQDNHTLSNKLSVQEAAHQGFIDELDHVKSQAETDYKRRLNMIEQNHSYRIQQLKWELDETKTEVERGIEREKSLKEKVSLQEEVIRKLHDETPSCSDSMKDELIDLQRRCSFLDCQKQELEGELSAQTHTISQLKDDVHSHETKIKELEETLTDRVKLSNELYHNLQEIQDQNKALNDQLERNKLQQLEEDWQGKGNSLFGEVEERRLETERKLISLQVKYDTLERTHQMLKTHFKKLKAEMSVLLCRHSSFAADLAHVERLETNLRQRNSEITRLNDKIRKLDKEIQESKTVRVAGDLDSKGKRFVDYLQNQIEQKDKSLCSVRKELETQATQLAWEGTKLTNVEAKLHKTEQEKAKLLNDATKMRLRLQEVKEKENELNVQLKMAENEISTLKNQLKVNLRKGHSVQETDTPKTDQNASRKTTPNTTAVIVKEEKQEPINLLEEIEKENSTPPPPPVAPPSINASLHSALLLSSYLNETNVEKAKGGSVSPSPLSPAKENESSVLKSPAPSTPAVPTLKVIKVEDNVNRCPQQ
ncbi:PREDICTED: protein Spindly-like [Amphimedon queenslandica]|uniref:Uncharacterized protein n=1 Tax=Amphimedon queenslandica TaxID=400682 RepID=A0A1X7VCN8_AMPQE|nr:PREDICTED: protein Spindly-like [Amphimedon queenslandica]|eukprot:XP_019849763.1 PREDICTED: protein Spindly-like [Amphimedon queenslandica]